MPYFKIPSAVDCSRALMWNICFGKIVEISPGTLTDERPARGGLGRSWIGSLSQWLNGFNFLGLHI